MKIQIIFIISAVLVAHRVFATGIPTLDELVVTAKADELLGVASASSEGTVTAKQLESLPILRPAEIMEVIPGLIISQHSGDGKANQYYLRGFNLDHGTDFSTSLMGMPVNLPTHAHGQGYTDLNFLIPELVDRIQYRKGTYYAGDGDFSAAGSARIDYVRKLDAPFVQTTLGNNGYARLLTAATPTMGSGNLLLAGEAYNNDGPWVVPEHMFKDDFVARYTQGRRDDGMSVTVLAYDARWTATDQIAQRAMDTVGRYGSLDPTTGGNTHRNSVSANLASSDNHGISRVNAYYIDYALDLWSNFTYAIDPVHGDQFLQSDKRSILGGSASHTWAGNIGDKSVEATIGTDLRSDDIKNGVFLTQYRKVWGTVRDDSIKQTSFAVWSETQIQWLERFRSTLGLRADSYRFDVISNTPANTGKKKVAILSPKLALVFGPWNKTEYYFNAGYGFHSNDARGTVTTVNPDPRPGIRPTCVDSNVGSCTGDPLSPVKPLVRATGYEIGARTALLHGLQSTLTLWRLNIASELIFVGDAGTTSPSRPSQRQGLEWANFWNPKEGLLVDGDLSLSRARFTDDDPAGNRIPGAIEQSVSIGVSLQDSEPWSAGIRLRYFGPLPLIEDNSVRSKSSTLVNLQAGYKITEQLRASIDILNLFNNSVSDIDYYYASQLPNEAAPMNDIHTHPAEPRALRVTLKLTL